MKISYIITTYNRFATLANHISRLNFIKELQNHDIEIIISDDGSNDETKKMCERYLKDGSIDRYVNTESYNEATPSKARNMGIEIASGELLIFSDDDCIPHLYLIDEYIETDKGIVSIGYKKCDKKILNLNIHDKDAITESMEGMAATLYFQRYLKGNFGAGHFTSGSFAISRADLGDVRFDEDFKGYGYEDKHFGYLLRKKGLKFDYKITAISFHDDKAWNRARKEKNEQAIINKKLLNEKLNKKIIFLPFYAQCPEHRYSASARIRAEWVAEYMPADIISEKTTNIELADYDFVIFQKCFSRKFFDIARRIREKNPNVKIGLDLCDPVWVGREEETEDMVKEVDFITVPTKSLGEEIYSVFGDIGKKVYLIPDGHDLKYYKIKSRKLPSKKIGLKYVWYGNSGTIKSLQEIMQYLEDVSLKGDSLTIIADPIARGMIESNKLEIIFKEWKLDTVNEQVASCDISLNPKLNTKEYYFKSNNKTVMSYILKVPCIELNSEHERAWIDNLTLLKDFTNRRNDVKIKRDKLIKDFRIETIVDKWKDLLIILSK